MKAYTVSWWENMWSKVKTLQDKPRSRWLVFLTNCVKHVIEKAASICVIIQQDCKVKRKLKLHNIKVSSTTVWRYVTNKGWKALKRKKAVHTSCRHGIRRICKLYTKGRPAGKLTWCEPSSNHLDYRWWDNIQRSSPQNTRLAKTATMPHLGNCEFRHAMGAHTFYTSPLNY